MVIAQRRSSRRLGPEPIHGDRRLRSAKSQPPQQVAVKRKQPPSPTPEPHDGSDTLSEIAVLPSELVQALELGMEEKEWKDEPYYKEAETTVPEPVVGNNTDGNETQSEIIVLSPENSRFGVSRGVKRKRHDVATKRSPLASDIPTAETGHAKRTASHRNQPDEVHPGVEISFPSPLTTSSGQRRTRQTRHRSRKTDDEPEPNVAARIESGDGKGRKKRALGKQPDVPEMHEPSKTRPRDPDSHQQESNSTTAQHDADSAKSDAGQGPSTPSPHQSLARRILGSGTIRKWISYVRYPSPDSVHSSDIGSGQETPEEEEAQLQPKGRGGGIFNIPVSPINFGRRPNRAANSLEPKPAWRNLDSG